MGGKMRREEYMGCEEHRDRERPYELWLCSFPNVGNRQLVKLTELCGSARGVYFAGVDKWRQVLKEKQVESLKRFTEGWKPQAEYEKFMERGIQLVTLADAQYPERLREIPDAPYGLFIKGSQPEDGEPAVAVIGARECSPYGSFVAEKLGEILGRHGITVVSGMARGIDGISQRAALDAGGRSWGILGCGVDVCYPRENKALYDRLPGHGCLISSYPPGTPALARNFPPRNRIVSGLADAVVVVEAREKSGTLITVDMALEQGKEVYAVPGRITDRLSDGCNRLIRQGAVPLLNPEELIQELYGLQERKHGQGKRTAGEAEKIAPLIDKVADDKADNGKVSGIRATNIKMPDDKAANIKISDSEAAEVKMVDLPPELSVVYRALDLTPRTVDEIRERLPQSQSAPRADINLNACLVRLCLENLAVQVSPGYFSGKNDIEVIGRI